MDPANVKAGYLRSGSEQGCKSSPLCEPDVFGHHPTAMQNPRLIVDGSLIGSGPL